jgi:hypothetical protein
MPKPKIQSPKPILTTYIGSPKILQKSSPANPFPGPYFQPNPPPNHNLPGFPLTDNITYGKYIQDIQGKVLWKIIPYGELFLKVN